MDESWKDYSADEHYDELLTSAGNPRQIARNVAKLFSSCSAEELAEIKAAAELTIKDMGVTFTVYSEGENIDRSWPYDVIPRVISAREWASVSKGLIQRSRALNCFIDDVYNKQSIFADKVVPPEVVLDSPNFKKQCVGISPKHKVWAHINGSDLIRDKTGHFYVLEDNLRVPSGVSYMLENRQVTKRVLPELFENNSILPVNDYPTRLYQLQP